MFIAAGGTFVTGNARMQVVDVSGRPFEMGRQIGEECVSKARAQRKGAAEAISHYTGMSWRNAVERAKFYLPYAAEFYPDFVEEIRGYAEGVKMPFDDVFALCCPELSSSQGFHGCTDVVVSEDVTQDGSVLACHNEDWNPGALKNVVLVRAKPSGKPSFISTCYAGLIPTTGMNDRGISITGNALSANDVRVGIPRLFPVRRVLEARRIGEALTMATPPGRASSYNNICSERTGEIYSLEGSATDCATLYAAAGHLVHTNHYTVETMRKFEAYPNSIAGSVVRYNRAKRLLKRQLGSVTIESVKELLRDHVNMPESICGHAKPSLHPSDTWETIFSVIYDLTDLSAHVCRGHPCEGRYYRVDIE